MPPVEPTLGLPLAYFHEFIASHGGRDAFDGLTTCDVCERMVKPLTESSNLSLLEYVRSQPGGDQHATPAQWLISHSWSYKFLDVVDAIDNFCAEHALGADTSFWFCMFANNQHTIGDPAVIFKHWLHVFRSALEFTGQLVMVLSPWDDPETLKRTWCVYEVYLSVMLKARFEIAMGKSQQAEFVRDIQDAYSVNRIFAKVNTANSTTTVPSDRERIFELIKKEVGMAELDRIVFGAFKTWILRALDVLFDAATSPADKFRWLKVKAYILAMMSDVLESVAMYERAVAIFRSQLPPSHWEGWEATVQLGMVKAIISEPSETWAPQMTEALAHLEELLGPEHATTLDCMKNVGKAFCKSELFDRGTPLLHACLATETRLGHPDASNTLGDLGESLYLQGNYVDAAHYLQLAYEGMSPVLGDNHPRTLSIVAHLALCKKYVGKYVEAEAVAQTAYEGMVRVYGPVHKVPISPLANLMMLQRYNGQYDLAEENIRMCLDWCRRLDFDEMITYCERELGYLAYARGDLDSAATILDSMYALFVAKLGVHHLRSRMTLAVSYLVHVESGTSMESVNDVAAWEAKFLAANMLDTTAWSVFDCISCCGRVEGDLFMCMECPRLSRPLCRTCFAAQPTLDGCGHSMDTSWTSFQPPCDYLTATKLKLLGNAIEDCSIAVQGADIADASAMAIKDNLAKDVRAPPLMYTCVGVLVVAGLTVLVGVLV